MKLIQIEDEMINLEYLNRVEFSNLSGNLYLYYINQDDPQIIYKEDARLIWEYLQLGATKLT